MDSALLQAAAAALGIPPELVERSAAARAAADGTDIDAVLGGWAGGEPPPKAVAPPPVVADQPPPKPEPQAADTSPAPVREPPASPSPLPAALVGPPPLLVGRPQSLRGVVAGSLAILLAGLLVTVVLPGTESSALPLSASEVSGLDVYVAEGCSYCHTRQIRPIVTDANLGPVLAATDVIAEGKTLGFARFGPDLSNIDGRGSDPDQIAALLTHGEHAAYSHLTDEEMADLTAFLMGGTR